jgi:hypothetical protein
MIDKININQIPDPRQVGDDQAAGKRTPPKPPVDDQIQIDFGRLIEQATKMPPAETDAVRKASELLQSGQLDSPANIREAAENILKFGI